MPSHLGVSCRVVPIPAALLGQLRTVQLDIRCHSTARLPTPEALAALGIQAGPFPGFLLWKLACMQAHSCSRPAIRGMMRTQRSW